MNGKQWMSITKHTPLSNRVRGICHRRITGGFATATVTFDGLSPDEIREEIRSDIQVLDELGFNISADDGHYIIHFTEER